MESYPCNFRVHTQYSFLIMYAEMAYFKKPWEKPVLPLTSMRRTNKINKKRITLMVNAVAYIFSPERICHRLRADSEFGYIAKFGAGVAFKISSCGTIAP
jgi:hypothetical protein